MEVETFGAIESLSFEIATIITLGESDVAGEIKELIEEAGYSTEGLLVEELFGLEFESLYWVVLRFLYGQCV